MKSIRSLQRELAKLKAQQQTGGRGRKPMGRFWDAVAGAQLTPPLTPKELPPGVLEVLEQYEKEGPPRYDQVEQRIQEALQRSTREHEHQQEPPR